MCITIVANLDANVLYNISDIHPICPMRLSIVSHMFLELRHERAGKKEKEQFCTREVYYRIGLLLPERQGADCLPLGIHWVMGAMASARAPESWLQHTQSYYPQSGQIVFEKHTADLKCTHLQVIASCFTVYQGIRRSSIAVSHAAFKLSMIRL